MFVILLKLLQVFRFCSSEGLQGLTTPLALCTALHLRLFGCMVNFSMENTKDTKNV